MDTLEITTTTDGDVCRIRVYSVKTMNPLAVLSYHRDSVYCVDFATQDGDKHWVIGCSKDHRISLWHVY
jgi:WD40 repeat protein